MASAGSFNYLAQWRGERCTRYKPDRRRFKAWAGSFQTMLRHVSIGAAIALRPLRTGAPSTAMREGLDMSRCVAVARRQLPALRCWRPIARQAPSEGNAFHAHLTFGATASPCRGTEVVSCGTTIGSLTGVTSEVRITPGRLVGGARVPCTHVLPSLVNRRRGAQKTVAFLAEGQIRYGADPNIVRSCGVSR